MTKEEVIDWLEKLISRERHFLWEVADSHESIYAEQILDEIEGFIKEAK